jgi:hypothetical protein
MQCSVFHDHIDPWLLYFTWRSILPVDILVDIPVDVPVNIPVHVPVDITIFG